MEFTVFTNAGGFREFPGDSSYRIGEDNGVLYVVDGATGQVMAYGPNAWASIQEWQREAAVVPPEGGRHAPAPPPPPLERTAPPAERAIVTQPPQPAPAMPAPVMPAPRLFDPLTDPLDSLG